MNMNWRVIQINKRKFLKSLLRLVRSLLLIVSRYSKSQYTLEKGSSANEITRFFRLFTAYDTGYDLIRVGSLGDGGYLIPNDIEGITHCFSPGVGETCTFENHLASSYGIKSLLIDDTVTFPAELHTMNEFESLRLGLDSVPGVSVTLDDWVTSKVHRENVELMLQMDIETHEWLSLLNTSINTLSRFRIMVIEFHSLSLVRFPYTLARVYLPTISKLLVNFDIVHVHPNNSVGIFKHGRNSYPETVEVTFHRKDRRKTHERLISFSHVLDYPSNPEIAEIDIDTIIR